VSPIGKYSAAETWDELTPQAIPRVETHFGISKRTGNGGSFGNKKMKRLTTINNLRKYTNFVLNRKKNY
jgi:hypothetical protein